MSIELYALANSKPPALLAARAAPTFLQKPRPLSARRPPEMYFGRIEPRLQYRPDLLVASRKPSLSSNTPISTDREETTAHDLRPPPERPWPGIVSKNYHRGFLGITAKRDTCQAVSTYAFVENHAANTPSCIHPALLHNGYPRFPSHGVQSFMLIERVRCLLDQQKIREARRTLEIGSSRDPANRQIASLLRAISTGRVSSIGRTLSGRERETVWIKQHAHEYRGKWVALEEDRLVAFAATLSELLACLDTGAERKKPPFVQHLISK